MAQLSINETTTYRWSFEEDVTEYLAAGVPAIGVWRQKLSDYGEAKAAELLAETGLKVSHLFWAGGFTGSDGRSFRSCIEDSIEALRTAQAIGARTLVVYSGPRAGHTHNHARRLFRDALTELAPVADDLGVTLAVEPMHPGCAAEFTFLTTLDDVLGMLAAACHQRVKMVLDTYHLGWVPDLPRRIPSIINHVAIVQLGDAKTPPCGEQNRCRIGEGVLPLKETVAALRAAGYDGYYDVELLGEDVETLDYQTLLHHAKSAFEDLMRSAGS
ncbi:MAG: sugar phosphate isomerase/epimerase [Thermoguttaceae bacterium]|jgi:sugar phosphate isomerase/epimerase|nr:sugar phosphate isomerase/epimerase [Thermoguttaceae bacterium]